MPDQAFIDDAKAAGVPAGQPLSFENLLTLYQLLPRAIKFKIEDREFTIPQLRSGPESEWQDRVEAAFGAIGGVLGLMAQARGETAREAMNNMNIADVGQALNSLQRMLFGSMKIVRGLLFDYAGDSLSKEDRKYIEANSYSDEIAGVFMGVLQLSYPLGSLGKRLVGAIQRSTM